jgi:hypothetical protein
MRTAISRASNAASTLLRSAWLTSISALMKRCSSSEYVDGIRSNRPALIFIASASWLEASNGGCKAHISYSRQPSDHMSLFSL